MLSGASGVWERRESTAGPGGVLKDRGRDSTFLGSGSEARRDDNAAEGPGESGVGASLCPPVTGMSCGKHHIGYMFLAEVALGREHHITINEPSLKQPPPGFNSVVARGHTEPGES